MNTPEALGNTSTTSREAPPYQAPPKETHPGMLSVFTIVPPILQGFLRAVELAAEDDRGFALMDVRHVEATWEIVDGDASAYGFVLALHDGHNSRRLYLQYVCVFSEDESEELEILPMQDERYPQLEGGGIIWNDEVADLNRFLRP